VLFEKKKKNPIPSIGIVFSFLGMRSAKEDKKITALKRNTSKVIPIFLSDFSVFIGYRPDDNFALYDFILFMSKTNSYRKKQTTNSSSLSSGL
jgi:hypothetical protein